MATKKVFISYDYTNDKHYKNLLLAWDKNKDFDFNFSDQSADVSIDSNDAARIKAALTTKISNSTYFLCIIGKTTKNSKWVKWEIDKAVELKKKLVAVKIEKPNEAPANILNVGAKWALSFTFESIKSAIESA